MTTMAEFENYLQDLLFAAQKNNGRAREETRVSQRIKHFADVLEERNAETMEFLREAYEVIVLERSAPRSLHGGNPPPLPMESESYAAAAFNKLYN